MTNKAHSTLTGSDLHILKGADTATVGQVPVSNGSGDAPFGKLTASSLTGTGNPFGASLLHVREEQASGVATALVAIGAYGTEVLNTIKTNEISGATLVANQISLPAGTYWLQALCPVGVFSNGAAAASFRSRLRNTTDSTTLVLGHVGFCRTNVSGATMDITASGRFTLAGTKTLEYQTYSSSSSPNRPAISAGGENEIYCDVMIWKIL